MEKTVLITGAKGGLGNALVNEFADHSWKVVVTDLSEKICNDFHPGDRIIELPMDVTSEEAIQSVVEKIRSAGILLDLIINNAGIDGYFPLSEAPFEMFFRIFDVNVFGSYRVNRAFLPLMKAPGGKIIQISSESVKLNVPFMTYPVSKQTLEGYCRTLRLELRFLGIDVTMVRPGPIRTPMVENVRQMKNPVEGSRLNGPFGKFASMAYREIGKIAEPREIARFIFRIASKKRMKPVYQVNNDPKLAISSFIPFSLLEKIITKRLR
jgi:NAD(P)-dependent dehydrogenase (short-subunit alcohol dehydrogenase family)